MKPIRRDIAGNLRSVTSLAGAIGSVVAMDGRVGKIRIGGLRSDYVATAENLRQAISAASDSCRPNPPLKKP